MEFNDFSYYLESYKNNFVAYGLNNSDENKKLLNQAKNGLQMIHNEQNIHLSKLIDENNKKREEIKSLNKIIKKSKKKNLKLNTIKNELTNSDLGAISQDNEIDKIYNKRRNRLILEVCLIIIILIFIYINDNVFQKIGSRFSKKTK